ncbi:MAG: TonB-dependent receptor [Prevotellaceae bacterium]|jgi:iron complex outermembrane receptor protein|nr:TonB-dependent receptor [Prevotellaceae bacterium]
MKNETTKTIVCFCRWTRKSYAVFNSLGKQIKIGVLAMSLSLVTLDAQRASAQATAAQASEREQETDPVPIGEVTITGDKALAIAEPARVVATISRSDIERAAVQNIQDLLRYVDGLDVRTRGGNNVQADISLRGGTFDQTVVLLNGVNITDPQTGHHSLNIPINLEEVQRIEVLQGPGAWTMGAVTYSGAINIITRLANQTGATAGLIQGMHGYRSSHAAGTFSANGLRTAASASKSKSDGYAANTDFDVDNVYAQLRYATPKSGIVSGQFGYQNKDFGANNFYSPKYPYQYEHTRTFLSSLRYSLERGSWGASATLYHRQHQDRYELFHINPPTWYTGHNYHRTDMAGALVQLTRISKLGTTTAGVSYRYEHIYSNTLGEPMQQPLAVKDESGDNALYTKEKAREHFSASLQHSFRLQKFHATLGVMGAGNNDFGVRAYVGGNAAYDLSPAWQLSAAAGNDYRLPTFTDLYYNVGDQRGNPRLKPEEAVTGELALRYRYRSWRAAASGFYRYGYNIINWRFNPTDSLWHSQNITNVATSGVHLYVEYAPQKLLLQKVAAGYTYLYVTPSGQQETASYVVEQLSHRLTATLQHGVWSRLAASWQLQYQQRAGRYQPFDVSAGKYAEATAFKPFWLCDLKIYWEEERYSIFVAATNLFNNLYLDFGNIPQPGRWVKVGLKVRVKS